MPSGVAEICLAFHGIVSARPQIGIPEDAWGSVVGEDFFWDEGFCNWAMREKVVGLTVLTGLTVVTRVVVVTRMTELTLVTGREW